MRISAGVISIAVGFGGGSTALALISMSDMLGPRFAWLGFLLGFAAFCSVVTGFVEIVRLPEFRERRGLPLPLQRGERVARHADRNAAGKM